jgi:N-acetylglutamate synthase-like GNAT family acetyltransferase
MKDVGRVAYTKDLVRDLINSKDSFCFKLIESDQIIGALGARSEGMNSSWLYFVVIKDQYRGRAYAKELMNRFFEEAKKKGLKRVALDTPDKDFFVKFGFQEVGRIPKWYEDRDQIIMFKNLE